MTTTTATEKAPRIDFCREVADKIIAGSFDCLETEKVSIISQLNTLQIRSEDSLEQIQDIADAIDELDGSIENTDPVLIWEGADENGEDLIGDGNHTLRGIVKSKSTVIKTRRIPQQVWESMDITMIEMVMIGSFMNKKPEKFKLCNDRNTFYKHLISLKVKCNVDIDSESSHDYLKSAGITTRKKRNVIIKNAVELWMQKQLEGVGKKVKQYGQNAPQDNNDELMEKCDRLRDSSTMIVYGSTGASKNLECAMLSELTDEKVNGKKHKIAFVLYHNKFEHKTKWDNDGKSAFINKMQKTLNKMKPVEVDLPDGGKVFYDYTMSVHYMDFLESDGSQFDNN